MSHTLPSSLQVPDRGGEANEGGEERPLAGSEDYLTRRGTRISQSVVDRIIVYSLVYSYIHFALDKIAVCTPYTRL